MAGQTTYTDIGYDKFFRKQQQPANGQEDPYFLQSLYSSQDVQATDNSLLQQVSANSISGGVMESTGGNLSIDLGNGILNYTDGVTNLLSIDPVNGLTINNAQGTPIVQSGSSNQGG